MISEILRQKAFIVFRRSREMLGPEALRELKAVPARPEASPAQNRCRPATTPTLGNGGQDPANGLVKASETLREAIGTGMAERAGLDVLNLVKIGNSLPGWVLEGIHAVEGR